MAEENMFTMTSSYPTVIGIDRSGEIRSALSFQLWRFIGTESLMPQRKFREVLQGHWQIPGTRMDKEPPEPRARTEQKVQGKGAQTVYSFKRRSDLKVDFETHL
ncbi:hypothetical protein ACLB2K_017331 [Fragaria x ananassa]